MVPLSVLIIVMVTVLPVQCIGHLAEDMSRESRLLFENGEEVLSEAIFHKLNTPIVSLDTSMKSKYRLLNLPLTADWSYRILKVF